MRFAQLGLILVAVLMALMPAWRSGPLHHVAGLLTLVVLVGFVRHRWPIMRNTFGETVEKVKAGHVKVDALETLSVIASAYALSY